jgi:ABC-type Zn uptake system ZnuABC Zn-binding protein ZnuA
LCPEQQEEWIMENTQGTQETPGMQGMPGDEMSLLDRIQAAVDQDPEKARQTLEEVQQRIQSMSTEQKAQLQASAEQLQARLQGLSAEKKAQIDDIMQKLRD